MYVVMDQPGDHYTCMLHIHVLAWGILGGIKLPGAHACVYVHVYMHVGKTTYWALFAATISYDIPSIDSMAMYYEMLCLTVHACTVFETFIQDAPCIYNELYSIRCIRLHLPQCNFIVAKIFVIFV